MAGVFMEVLISSAVILMTVASVIEAAVAPDFDSGALRHCDGDCPESHGWEVIQGFQHTPEEAVRTPNPPIDALAGNHGKVRLHSANVSRVYERVDSDRKIIFFGGYSSTRLCARFKRTEHIDGHSKCPLESDWFQLWAPSSIPPESQVCFVDNMRAYHNDTTGGLSSPPNTEVRMGNCPGDQSGEWKDRGYDWRYGGIRPQDNPDMQLYPEVKAEIEKEVKDTGKKVIVQGCSGGTINGYAFLMSQTLKWRQEHVQAFIAISPVFGGTVSSVKSILSGWPQKPMDRCTGRLAAEMVPSVPWMWPRRGLWHNTETLVMTKSRNYTAYDLDRMLLDMGLPKTKKLLDKEEWDYLMDFKPPMVDTYVFYGYGLPTEAGFSLEQRDFNPATDGEWICPDGQLKSLVRPEDDGDVVGPLRSVDRAKAWADSHKQANIVLENKGYEKMSHTCKCDGHACAKDYICTINKLNGRTC